MTGENYGPPFDDVPVNGVPSRDVQGIVLRRVVLNLADSGSRRVRCVERDPNRQALVPSRAIGSCALEDCNCARWLRTGWGNASADPMANVWNRGVVVM